jgi:hypothetical protein
MRRLLAIALVVAACGGAASSSPASPSPSPATSEPAAEPSPSASGSATPEPTPDLPTAWSPLTPTGDLPAAREDHTWTVDPATQTAYLFGGRDGSTVFGDLFAFDLATNAWRRLDSAGTTPPARFGHESNWVPGVGLVIFAGQASATAFFGDLWSFDPAANAWTQLPAGGDAPVPRYGSCSGLGPDGRLWISHGFTEDGTRFFDTKVYDFGLGRWTDLTPAAPVPVSRCLHACWWTTDRTLTLYGGQTTGVAALGDAWSLTPGGADTPGMWTQIQGTLPPERALTAFTTYGDIELIFGGRAIDRTNLADAYIVDSTGAFALLESTGAGASARASATLITDLPRSRALLFGGIGASGAFADMWQLGAP